MRESCPLCLGRQTDPFCETPLDRPYLLCASCDLVFVPRSHHLPETDECRRYLTHENDVHDERYRAFLARLADPMLDRLRAKAGLRGLDYGSGPGPALAAMFRESGFEMTLYDLYFAPDRAALARQYDFITCTETIEHFRDPLKDLTAMSHALGPGGWLGVMTAERVPAATFPSWYYRKDPTHVCFFSARTMQWIARYFSWTCEHAAPNVWLFSRTG